MTELTYDREMNYDNVIAVGYVRAHQIDKDFPNIERKNYASEAEYKKALQQQYIALRQQEYEYLAMFSAYDMYISSRSANEKESRAMTFGGNEQIAENCLEYGKGREPSTLTRLRNDYVNGHGYNYTDGCDSIPKRCAAKFTGCTVNNVSEIIDGYFANCAVTAICITESISGRLGYEGEYSYVYGATMGINASGIHGRNPKTGKKCEEGVICKGKYSVSVPTGPISELIKSGEIAPGDIISVKSQGTGSGFHVLTVASVSRDKSGKIIGYTLMDNNGGDTRTRLKYHDLNDPNDKTNAYNVLYTKTHEWANDKFEAEIAGKSPEELQRMIAETKGRIQNDVIVDLARAEQCILFDTSYLNTCGYTLKGVDRSRGLQDQQAKFEQFYREQYADLFDLGRNIELRRIFVYDDYRRPGSYTTNIKPTMRHDHENAARIKKTHQGPSEETPIINDVKPNQYMGYRGGVR